MLAPTVPISQPRTMTTTAFISAPQQTTALDSYTALQQLMCKQQQPDNHHHTGSQAMGHDLITQRYIHKLTPCRLDCL